MTLSYGGNSCEMGRNPEKPVSMISRTYGKFVSRAKHFRYYDTPNFRLATRPTEWLKTAPYGGAGGYQGFSGTLKRDPKSGHRFLDELRVKQQIKPRR